MGSNNDIEVLECLTRGRDQSIVTRVIFNRTKRTQNARRESDAPYSILRQRQNREHQSRRDAPETRAFLREALDEVCSDFERTLERTSLRRKKAVSCNERDGGFNGGGAGGLFNGPLSATGYGMASDRNNNHQPMYAMKTDLQPPKLGNAAWLRDNFTRNGYSCNGKRLCYGWAGNC
ncbi:unnamed protein product [Ceratitis capitata]|uniref:(Mediterranean fruit fly) hypothetical protein n=1 Tax=Ceratitis capitata TaxID=7213 RepID=A0A811VCV8_CERCA|nr:unnamed protein product [Ceratitis capitata]